MNEIKPSLRSLSICDVEMRYLEYEGEGPAVLLLHATGFTPWLWHPIARELAGRYRVIAPFFCEQRTGDPERGGIRWMLLAEDLARFIREINAGRPILVGHSIGAAVASLAEAAFGPLAERMMLIEPIFLPEEFYSMDQPAVRQHPMASKAIRRGNFWRNAAEAKSYFLSRELFQSWDDEMLDLYIAHALVTEDHGLKLACSPRQEAALFMGDTRDNPWPLLKEIHCPVLVVEGGRSELKFLLDSGKAAQSFPMGSYLCVENAGHLIPMENPPETRRIIREFLNDTDMRAV